MGRLTPGLDEVARLAQSGEYRRIPVCRELYADRITPIEAMRALRAASSHCFMLESAEADQRWGRYTFLGFNPTLEITCAKGLLRIRSGKEDVIQEVAEEHVDHPGDAIRKILDEYKSAPVEGFPPFTGGLVGYFSYDYIRYSEPILRHDAFESDDFLDMDLMLFDRLIVFDSYRQKILLIAGVRTERLEESYAEAEKTLLKMEQLLLHGERKQFEPLQFQQDLQPAKTVDEFADMVMKAKRYIYDGDIFQVVLSNPLRAPAKGSLFDAYRILRCENPSPYMFYFTSNDVEIAGASPETLVKLTGSTLYTYPLAGTRPRGETPDEDIANEIELLQDEKELAEHNMLVDLGRNDLGRISEIGTVQVETYKGVLRFSRVMHIGSTVVGRIAPGKDGVDAIDSILPAGTLSGAPKIRACQIIDELEDSPRGIYGGAIGYLDFAGNIDTCIAIRLAYKKHDMVCVQSGAGIVADSDPLTEAQECKNKARAVVDALKESEGGLDQ